LYCTGLPFLPLLVERLNFPLLLHIKVVIVGFLLEANFSQSQAIWPRMGQKMNSRLTLPMFEIKFKEFT
jgi:hypothetical protein